MECTETFKKIKGLLMSAPVLVTPQFDKPFVLMVDASDLGVGGVLLQKDQQVVEHPIAYFSQKSLTRVNETIAQVRRRLWH